MYTCERTELVSDGAHATVCVGLEQINHNMKEHQDCLYDDLKDCNIDITRPFISTRVHPHPQYLTRTEIGINKADVMTASVA